ncbi:hypothetical protein [Nostocoides vanveenii]|uniref:hypothetical protein n=1 Tax=Nostocoides vanveenii TaxID=330835 RepID=UPI0031DF58C4
MSAAATLAVLLGAIAVWPPLTLGRSSPPLGPGAVTLHLPDRIALADGVELRVGWTGVAR